MYESPPAARRATDACGEWYVFDRFVSK